MVPRLENNEVLSRQLLGSVYGIVKDSSLRKGYVCNICSLTFPKECYLVLHMKVHRFMCLYCSKWYMKKKRLRQHIVEKHCLPLEKKENICTQEDFYCRDCDLKFESKYSYKIHFRMYHRSVYVCQKPFCGKTCIGREMYDIHRKAHQFSACIHCGKVVKDIYSHMLTHFKMYRCDLCTKDFSYPKDLRRHMLIHLKIKPFACSECGKKYRQRYDLIDHIKVHTQEKPFRCDICGESFSKSKSLRRHNQKEHQTKPENIPSADVSSQSSEFKCPQCPRSLKSLESLKTHALTHSESKPYSCSLCVKGFVTKGAYTRHTRVFHSNTHSESKPLSCSFCVKDFVTKGGLTKHTRLFHSDEENVAK